MDNEMGSMDGAYKGRLHVAWPFIGQKTLADRQKGYNDVHGFCRARIEHLFARMWHWAITRNVWRGSGIELHEYVLSLSFVAIFDLNTTTVPSMGTGTCTCMGRPRGQ